MVRPLVADLGQAEDDRVVLRLAETEPSVRGFLDDLLVDRGEGGTDRTSDAEDLPDAVASLAAETDYSLAHTDVFAVSVGN